MSNNYRTFAEIIALPRYPACYAVALDRLCSMIDDQGEKFEAPASLDIPLPTLPEGIDNPPAQIPVTDAMILDARAIVEERDNEWFGTSATFEVTTEGLRIASDESGDMEAIAAILQATMARFNLTGAVAIPWADTCSRLRAGEFGGGAVVITKDDIHWMTTGGWVNEKVKEIEDAAALAAGFQSA